MNSPNSSRSPFFAFAFFSRLTHNRMNTAVHMDEYLDEFFTSLQSSNLLQNTAVVVFSDHGLRYGTDRDYTRMAWYEENLPMSLIAMPEPFRQRYPVMWRSLELNSNSLTTPLDLHETVRRLLSVGQAFNETERSLSRRRGISLFDGQIGDRSCRQASIGPVYCECLLSSTTRLNTNNSQSLTVARKTVQKMNDILSIYNGSLKCIFVVICLRCEEFIKLWLNGCDIYPMNRMPVDSNSTEL